MKKFLLTSVFLMYLSCGVYAGEFTLDDKFDPKQEMSLSDLAKRSTPVREITGNKREELDSPPQQIPNSGIYIHLSEDMKGFYGKISRNKDFLYDLSYSDHHLGVSNAIYQYFREYLKTGINLDKRMQSYLSSLFKIEMKELGLSLEKNTWHVDKGMGSNFSLTMNRNSVPSIAFKQKDGKISNVVMPAYLDQRYDRDAYLRHGISFKDLNASDLKILDLITDTQFKKIAYKKPFKETLGDYLNGASNPTKLIPLNEGLRPEEIFIRDALLTATFRDEALKRARLSHLSKDRIPESVISYWTSNRGTVIPFYGRQYLFGVNMFGDISLIIPSNKAALPLLKEARNNPGCFIPFGHKMSDINADTGLFWLKRNKDRVGQVTNALIGVQNEEFNPLKKALREMSLNIKEDVHIPLNDNNKLALEGLNYLLMNSFVYNNDFLSACEKNKNLNKAYYDAVIAFIKDYRSITLHLLEPIVPLHGSLISRNRVPASFQDKFEKQGAFRGRDANGKPTQLPRKSLSNHYGDLSLEQLHKNTGLVFPFYQEDVARSLSLMPKGVALNDGHRVQGQGLIENLVTMGMTKPGIQDVLFTALDIPHNYSRGFIDPLTDNKNEDRFKTIGYAMEHLKKSEDLEKVMDLFKHLSEKEKLLTIFQNAKG